MGGISSMSTGTAGRASSSSVATATIAIPGSIPVLATPGETASTPTVMGRTADGCGGARAGDDSAKGLQPSGVLFDEPRLSAFGSVRPAMNDAEEPSLLSPGVEIGPLDPLDAISLDSNLARRQ